MEDETAEIINYNGTDEKIQIPETLDGYTVSSIGDYAYSYCRQLKLISFPEGINHVGSNPFIGCDEIIFRISPDHSYLAVIDDVLFSKPDKRLICCPNKKESYSVPEGIQSIGASAFSNCNLIISISLPDSVVKIGNSAFEKCESLTGIMLPDGITSIEESAFFGCKRLNEVVLPKHLEKVEDLAFCACDSLRTIHLPDDISFIGINPFSSCSNVQFNISTDHKYLSVIDDVLFSNPDKRLIYCPNTKVSYDVPEGTEIIGANGFVNCTLLQSVTLPETLNTMERSIFYGCSSLQDIKIPSGVISIPQCAFQWCNELTNVELPDGLVSIGESAFDGCTKLESIVVPDSITYINPIAFKNCNNLVLTVNRDTYASEYCNKMGLAYTYPDANDWLNN